MPEQFEPRITGEKLGHSEVLLELRQIIDANVFAAMNLVQRARHGRDCAERRSKHIALNRGLLVGDDDHKTAMKLGFRQQFEKIAPVVAYEKEFFAQDLGRSS